MPKSNRNSTVSILMGLFFCTHIFGTQVKLGTDGETSKAEVSSWMQSSRRLGFKENKGQVLGTDGVAADYVLFVTEVPGLNIWITKSGLTYQFLASNEIVKANREFPKWHRVDMILKGATIRMENIIKEEPMANGRADYYLGHCPDGILNVTTYSKVTIENVYPGIDWMLYTSTSGGLKHDFIVHPGADPNKIRLIYEGSGDIDIGDNQLRIFNVLGEIAEGQLLCHQGNKKDLIKSSYVANEMPKPSHLGAGNKSTQYGTEMTLGNTDNLEYDDVFSYELLIEYGEYDKSLDLIVDPELFWGTLYGGNVNDEFHSIEVDVFGNAWVTGSTNATTFPVLEIGGKFYQGTKSGASGTLDIFIIKFDNDGKLLWSTYYGGTGNDNARMITSDQMGNIWVTGTSGSVDFPTDSTPGAFFQGSRNGTSPDLFVLKFANDCTRLWATYYGGTAVESGTSISTDNLGNVWLTGFTGSVDFPTDSVAGAYFQGIKGGGAHDIYILKFSNSGQRLWASYYGGIGSDQANSISTDIYGNTWIVGQTTSGDFYTMPKPGAFFQGALAGGGTNDAFILRFNSSGALTWSTYYGGTGGDLGCSVKGDALGNAWVTGWTTSANFPTDSAPGAFFQGNHAGGLPDDVFILKFDSSGKRQWATYYGGTKNDDINLFDNLVIDDCNNVYVSFQTYSDDIPLFNPDGCHYYDDTKGGGPLDRQDGFITKFSNEGSLMWATYVGGDVQERQNVLAIDNKENLFMAGGFISLIPSNNMPLKDPGFDAYYDSTVNFGSDGYVLKFVPTKVFSTISKINTTTCSPCDGSATVNLTCGTAPYSYEWSNGESIFDTSSNLHSVNGLCAGNYNVIVTSNCNQKDTLDFMISGPAPNPGTTSNSICVGDSILLSGTFQKVAGIYLDTLFGGNYLGCDSILSTILTIKASDSCGLSDILYIPNSFTPNGDAFNDMFSAQMKYISEFHLLIFNRWGDKLFESNDPENLWDGTYKGSLSKNGVYQYQLSVSSGESTIYQHGNITIVH